MVSWDPWYVIGCIKWWLGNIQSVDIYKVWKYTQRGKYADFIEAPPRPGPHCGESYSHGHHHWTYTICTIHHVQTTIHKIYHIYIPPLWGVFYPPKCPIAVDNHNILLIFDLSKITITNVAPSTIAHCCTLITQCAHSMYIMQCTWMWGTMELGCYPTQMQIFKSQSKRSKAQQTA